MLRVGEAVCGYAASQLADGLGPEEARVAAVEAAGELAALAAQLMRLTRLRPADRRVLAVQLVGLGMSRREVADRLGVSDRAVRGYLARSRSVT
jgi:DNA-directed RNA polymerase specialized sigma24 family protein